MHGFCSSGVNYKEASSRMPALEALASQLYSKVEEDYQPESFS